MESEEDEIPNLKTPRGTRRVESRSRSRSNSIPSERSLLDLMFKGCVLTEQNIRKLEMLNYTVFS